MSEDTNQKDWWDKTEVLSKLIGALLIPVIVAVSVWVWNSERTLQQTSSTMTQIAVGILTGPPSPETQPLRAWAISVLQTPDAPPALSDEAALALQGTELAVITALEEYGWRALKTTRWQSLSSSRLQEIRDGWASWLSTNPELEGLTDPTVSVVRMFIEEIDAELERRGQ
ncbi:hypothetical protein LGQ03_16540 [Loktanella sp. TSTF-M6]|uniref:Uncharacterized protein n=1 Tax=Loktanella gaetbuli TaxID=2881335 RepID=A0ABS8BYN2_9RHOB|nr:hypothetical protein [Loktanella gaetbuli]MCB5200847.1 hypothetical protein [Loktanella gaetbuli]